MVSFCGLTCGTWKRGSVGPKIYIVLFRSALWMKNWSRTQPSGPAFQLTTTSRNVAQSDRKAVHKFERTPLLKTIPSLPFNEVNFLTQWSQLWIWNNNAVHSLFDMCLLKTANPATCWIPEKRTTLFHCLLSREFGIWLDNFEQYGRIRDKGFSGEKTNVDIFPQKQPLMRTAVLGFSCLQLKFPLFLTHVRVRECVFHHCLTLLRDLCICAMSLEYFSFFLERNFSVSKTALACAQIGFQFVAAFLRWHCLSACMWKHTLQNTIFWGAFEQPCKMFFTQKCFCGFLHLLHFYRCFRPFEWSSDAGQNLFSPCFQC